MDEDMELMRDELRELGDLTPVAQREDEPADFDEPVMIKAPALRSGSASNIVFLGYLDEPEELLSGTRRLLLGMDSDDDAAYLPTEAGITLPGGGTSAVPAPWSIAIARGGDTYVLGVDGNWSEL